LSINSPMAMGAEICVKDSYEFGIDRYFAYKWPIRCMMADQIAGSGRVLQRG
jgi:hypothetical protein